MVFLNTCSRELPSADVMSHKIFVKTLLQKWHELPKVGQNILFHTDEKNKVYPIGINFGTKYNFDMPISDLETV